MAGRGTRPSAETVSRKADPRTQRTDARALAVAGRGTRPSAETVSRKADQEGRGLRGDPQGRVGVPPRRSSGGELREQPTTGGRSRNRRSGQPGGNTPAPQGLVTRNGGADPTQGLRPGRVNALIARVRCGICA
ncbi:hypothetical protein SBRY_60170 [Actinacidiphila bryophytorum]|uniref:Uncharacterized protein n=1 Tax=Actinacidiphila bryophytorum TaxID=1436133 RepID=A0A9W4H611_9ACTN|nr:hypothetical protein SBRY_60170 [Actinacidiphila bryophytorum]